MRIQTSSKKQTALNLNVYRNLHHRSHHALKKKFEELAATLLKDTPPLGRIRLHYSVCPQTKRRLDISNVCSVIDKYFSDALTANGIIEDDDYTNLDFVSFGFGGLAEEEHVLVTITEIEEREPMKLSMTAELSVADVQAAVAAWVTVETGQEASAEDVTVTPDGGATVSVGGEPTPGPKPTRKRRTKAQIEADNKAAEEAKEDEQTGTSGSDSDSSGASEPAEEQVEETSNEAPDTETEEPESTEDKQPKNVSKESPEESSTTDSASEEDAPAPVKKRKKSSIFDQ